MDGNNFSSSICRPTIIITRTTAMQAEPPARLWLVPLVTWVVSQLKANDIYVHGKYNSEGFNHTEEL